ncbi:MAG: GspE/PulE family protein [Pseudomonadota bacterium]
MIDENIASPQRLGELLVQKNIISWDQLNIAILEQRQYHRPLGKILIELGFISEIDLQAALSENLGHITVDLNEVIADPEALAYITKEMARQYLVFPIIWNAERSQLVIAMVNPNNMVILDRVKLLLPREVDVESVLASESDVLSAIDRYYGYELSIDSILYEMETGEYDPDFYLTHHNDQYSHPVVRLVNALLSDAVQYNASDIHFEPEIGFVRIRYRIDGVLRQVRSLHRSYWPAIVVRLKVMSSMNIAENRHPQDGHMSFLLGGRSVDFRVATQPTLYGENIVIRILDRKHGVVSLESLGLSEDKLALLKIVLKRPEGVILVTGPTGSGKTTTLYAILNYLNTEDVNIMTLEDPVEYPIPRIRQTSVSEMKKFDFSNGIRSLMRQDPDIILVGEIRDKETAEMTFRAALTGHQVFSTLHTNSALGALTRLIDIGINPMVMANNIIAIMAQRLIRKLCGFCKESYVPSAEEMKLLRITEDHILYKAKGCDKCNHLGYKGRTTIIELIRVDQELDQLISDGVSGHILKKWQHKNKIETLVDDACRRVIEGVTSIEEMSRIVDLTDRILE